MIFPEAVKRYIQLQCNGYQLGYDNIPELDCVKKHYDSAPKSVLDLGAGLGRASVFLRNVWSWNDTVFTLLDGNAGNVQIFGTHDRCKPDYYNSFEAARLYCEANGLRDVIQLDAAGEWEKCGLKFDCVVSLLAIGFHWPVDYYLEKLVPLVKSGSYLFLQTRHLKGFAHQQVKTVKSNRDYQFIGLERCGDKLMLVARRVG